MSSPFNLKTENLITKNIYPKDANGCNVVPNYVLMTASGGLATWVPSRENPFTVDEILDISSRVEQNETDISNIFGTLENIYIDDDTIAVGPGAVDISSADVSNTINIGTDSLSNITGCNNQSGTVAIGLHSLKNSSNFQPFDLSGQERQNTAVGTYTGSKYGGGLFNVMMGYKAGQSIQRSPGNVYIGAYAGVDICEGTLITDPSGMVFTAVSRNVGIGASALQNACVTDSIAIGEGAMLDAPGTNDPCGNTFPQGVLIGIGNGVGALNPGEFNILMGNSTAVSISGRDNIVLGHGSLQNGTGSFNVFIGNNIGLGLGPGCNVEGNIAIGNSAFSNNTGTEIIAIGEGAVAKEGLTTSIAIGKNAGYGGPDGGGFPGYSAGTTESNIFIGENAGSNAAGSFSVAIGPNTLQETGPTSLENIAIGTNTGSNLINSSRNILVGKDTGISISGSEDNVAIGSGAGQEVGDRNIIFGTGAGKSNVGNENVFIGNKSGGELGTGGVNSNVGIGVNTLLRASSGNSNNVAIGIDTIKYGGLDNSVVIGLNSGVGISGSTGSSSSNIFIGVNSGFLGGGGGENVGIGVNTLSNISSSNVSSNIAIGPNAGSSISNNASNVTLIGVNSGINLLNPTNSIVIGNNSGCNTTTMTDCTIIGNNAGISNTSNGNVFIGNESGKSNITTSENTFIGNRAGENHVTGNQNTFIGFVAGADNTEANNSVFVGNRAGSNAEFIVRSVFMGQSAGGNGRRLNGAVIIGEFAGANINCNNFTTAPNEVENDIIIGTNACRDMQNSRGGNIVLGSEAGRSHSNSASNIVIGNIAMSASSSTYVENNIIIGNRAGTRPTSNENVCIGADAGNVVGEQNVLIGTRTGGNSASNSSNTIIGSYSAFNMAISNVTNNVIMGTEVLGSNITLAGATSNVGEFTGSNNVLLGDRIARGTAAANVDMEINSSIILGKDAGYNITSNTNETVIIGSEAGKNGGSSNVFIGYQSGCNANLSSTLNTFVGYLSAGDGTVTGDNNTGIGALSLLNLTSGINNVAIGGSSGRGITSGSCNTMIGYNTGCNINTESVNTFVGFDVGQGGIGSSNVFMGASIVSSGFNMGDSNIVVGVDAAKNMDANSSNNLIMGVGAVKAGNTNIMSNNIVFGNEALRDKKHPIADSIFIGSRCGCNVGSPVGNLSNVISLGTQSAMNITGYSAGSVIIGTSAGSNFGINTVAGCNSMFSVLIGNQVAVDKEGYKSICIGESTGYESKGNNDIFLGSRAGYKSGSNSAVHSNILIGENAGYQNAGSCNIIIGSTTDIATTHNKNYQIKIGTIPNGCNSNTHFIVGDADISECRRALHLTSVDDGSGTGIWLQGLKDGGSNNNWFIGHGDADSNTSLEIKFDDSVQVSNDNHPCSGATIARFNNDGSVDISGQLNVSALNVPVLGVTETFFVGDDLSSAVFSVDTSGGSAIVNVSGELYAETLNFTTLSAEDATVFGEITFDCSANFLNEVNFNSNINISGNISLDGQLDTQLLTVGVADGGEDADVVGGIRFFGTLYNPSMIIETPSGEADRILRIYGQKRSGSPGSYSYEPRNYKIWFGGENSDLQRGGYLEITNNNLADQDASGRNVEAFTYLGIGRYTAQATWNNLCIGDRAGYDTASELNRLVNSSNYTWVPNPIVFGDPDYDTTSHGEDISLNYTGNAVGVGNFKLEYERNVYMGFYAGYKYSGNLTKDNNVAIGTMAGYRPASTVLGTGVGDEGGSCNVYLGMFAGCNDGNNKDFNIGIGFRAGASNSAAENTFIGVSSGSNNNGDSNIGLGQNSSSNNSGDSNVYIGLNAGVSGEGSNNIVLGNHVAGTQILSNDNIMILGNTDITEVNNNPIATSNIFIGNSDFSPIFQLDESAGLGYLTNFEGKSNDTCGNVGLCFLTYTNSNLDTRWIVGNVVNTGSTSFNFYYDSQSNAYGDSNFLRPDGSVATRVAYIESAGSDTQLNFTGQHRCSGDAELVDYTGYIVRSTGHYRDLSGVKDAITLNNALPIVELVSSVNDKAVFGVISDGEDDSEQRTYALGNFVSVFPKVPGDNRLIINSVGEGAIWVCDINGNLENGDYITTCEVPGLGAKQGDDLLHNYTVAKITMDCDFDRHSWYRMKEVEHDGVVYNAALVGCTYHCG